MYNKSKQSHVYPRCWWWTALCTPSHRRDVAAQTCPSITSERVFQASRCITVFRVKLHGSHPGPELADVRIHVPPQPFVCGAQHLKCVPSEGISVLLVWLRGWTDLSSVLKRRVGELDSCTGHVHCSACVTLGRH